MSFIRNALLNIYGSVLLVLLNFITGIILARALSPNGLGQYSLVISLVTILGLVISLGLGEASIYYINNRKKDPATVITAVVKTTLLLSAISVAVIFAIFQNEQFFGVMTTWAIIYIAVIGFSIVLVENLLKVPLAFMRIDQYVGAQILPVVSFLLLITIAFIGDELTTLDAWFFMAMAQLAGVLLLFYYIREFLTSKRKSGFNDVIPLAKYGSKMNLSYIALLLNSEVGLFLVRQFTADFNEVGYYRLAIRLAGVLLLVPKSLGPLFFSKWSKTERHIRIREVEQATRIFFLFGLAGILILEIIAEKFIFVFYGAAYLPAVPVFRIILIGIGARFLMTPVFNLFSSSGKPLFPTYSLMAGLLSTVVFMCVLIPVYGGTGAAMAFTIGNITALVMCFYLASRRFDLDISNCAIAAPGDLRFIREKIFDRNKK